MYYTSTQQKTERQVLDCVAQPHPQATQTWDLQEAPTAQDCTNKPQQPTLAAAESEEVTPQELKLHPCLRVWNCMTFILVSLHS
jgi:hypothetical protein